MHITTSNPVYECIWMIKLTYSSSEAYTETIQTAKIDQQSKQSW